MADAILKNWVIIFILSLAAFLRLYRISDYMTFLGDEGRDVLVAYDILHGKLTLLGPTASVGGFFLGPIYYYFITPFLWFFNYNPAGPAVMIALFGIFTVWLVYKIGTEFFGRKAGVIASFLYAISPIVVAYSRSSWNPNLMPPFTLLTLYILYKGVNKNKPLFFFITGILYGILMQLHYIEVFVGVIIIVYVFISWALKNKQKKIFSSVIKPYLMIFFGFLVGFSPYLAFEARHGFPNTASLIKFIFNSPEVGGGSNLFLIIGNVFFRLFARLVMGFPPPERIESFSKNILFGWSAFILLISLISFGYFLFRMYESIKKRDEKLMPYLLINTWLILGIFFFGFYKKPIYDYYFQFLFPLPFFLIGFTAEFFLSKQKIFKFITALVIVFLILLNLNGIPFRHPPNRQLNQMKTIADFIMTKTDAKPFNFAIITGGNSDHAYRYFFTIWNHPPVIIQDSAHDPQRNTVTEQLFIVCESVPCEPLGNSLWEIAGFGRAEIAGSWDVSVVKVYKLVHYKGN